MAYVSVHIYLSIFVLLFINVKKWQTESLSAIVPVCTYVSDTAPVNSSYSKGFPSWFLLLDVVFEAKEERLDSGSYECLCGLC
jgi:hypothetical protein